MNQYESRARIKTVAAIVTIVVIVGIAVLIEVLQHKSSTSSSSQTTATTSSPAASSDTSTPSAASSSTASTYKDGTYTAQISYYVPHGTESIGVTLTVADGTVTDSSITNSESDHDSRAYQEDFADEYKTSVVGKKLSDVNLSYVAGASDTTQAFNDAVAQIRTQAQALAVRERLDFDAIGTRWRIEYDPASGANTQEIEAAIKARIDRFDRSFSRFRPDSWVNKVRRRAGHSTLPSDAHELLNLYTAAYAVTDGAVTPLIGTLLEQAGYDPAYSFTPGTLSDVPRFDAAVSFTRRTLTTTEPVLLDFGAAGKGYLVDQVGALLRDAGARRFVVNAGGDILHYDSAGGTITVGLENPADLSEVIGTCELGNGSVCASAGSKRHWGGFTHIIDPRDKTSPSAVAGVWVKAETAAVADIVSTALFFAAPKALAPVFHFSYAVLGADTTLTANRGFGFHAFTGAAV